jgi:hypothetical protein
MKQALKSTIRLPKIRVYTGNRRDNSWLGLFFDSEDGSDKFFRNVGRLSTDYTALYLRK